jgi:hypothetical protein
MEIFRGMMYALLFTTIIAGVIGLGIYFFF